MVRPSASVQFLFKNLKNFVNHLAEKTKRILIIAILTAIQILVVALLVTETSLFRQPLTKTENVKFKKEYSLEDSKNIPQESDPAFSVGTVTDSVYTDPYFGFNFTLPEGWNFSSNADLATLNGIDEAAQTDSKCVNKIVCDTEDVKVFTEMKAQDASHNSVTVSVRGPYSSGFGQYTNQEILELMQTESTEAMNGKAENPKSETGTTAFLSDNSTPCLNTTYTVNTIPVYSKQICLVNKGGYTCVITVTTNEQDGTGDILNSFAAVKQ